MSNEQTPILSGAIPSFEMFMSRWEKLITEQPRLEHVIQPGLIIMAEWTAHVLTLLQCVSVNYFFKKSNDTFAVLNPSIHMSWIRNHWDRDYISQAEGKIWETVSHFRISWACLTHCAQDAGIS